ncbi:MAG: threonylcarbamoyl-AMP synthase [Candidatus Omnitrophica bacterium]|nr:threonylcarbamoyl-AMP synthase [Candidatus Omnitrophota bacterium]
MSLTKIVRIDPRHIKEDYIHEAARILNSGGLAILPTETVYGVGASMLNQKAVTRLYEIKKRPQDKPFSVHIARKDKVEEFARSIPVSAYKLIDKFWPGPLTVILKSVKGGATVGLRMPDNEITLKVIDEVHGSIVLPSANLSGNPPAKDFEEAIKDLDGLVDFAIDAGETRLGLESSIVDLTKENPDFPRIGAIRKEDLDREIAKKNVLFICTGNSCRSVMAEAILKKIMREQKRDDVEVSSAGIMMISGIGVSSGTKEALAREGIDVTGHLSHKITKEMARRSDLILVMEKVHEDAVLRVAPEVKNRVFLLKEFAKIDDGHLNIADPIGKSSDFYEKTLASIKEAVERVSKLI